MDISEMVQKQRLFTDHTRAFAENQAGIKAMIASHRKDIDAKTAEFLALRTVVDGLPEATEDELVFKRNARQTVANLQADLLALKNWAVTVDNAINT